MAEQKIPTITLLTDYGTRDGYVASMKGAILSINSSVNIVDISHDIAPQDILEAAFVLRSAFSYFPVRTIHVVVVDPTVGSARKILMVSTDNYYFVAPDNGVLSLIYDIEPFSSVVQVSAEHYFRGAVSNTFHGRDIMAPVAAWLSKGNPMDNFGEPTENYLRLSFPKPKVVAEGTLKGNIVHIDRFGNLITNVTRNDYEELRSKTPGENFKTVVGKQEINGLKNYYAQGQKGELLTLFGSSDFLEIAQTQGSAAKTLGVSRGAEIGIVLK
jgi:S-adenosyl-L-methionine hydrolase (adenosine-forming)